MFRKRRRSGRRQLVERKHRLEGEIRALQADIRRRRAREQDASALEERLARLRDQHHRTRMEIDRAAPDS